MTDQNANSQPNNNNQLISRGILESALEANWQASQRAWVYPIYDLEQQILVYRCKATNSDTKPKYWWKGKKPDNCFYYLLPGLQAAITENNGLLFIASGEPDVLSFKSAGLDHVLCWFGEVNVPPNLVPFLQSLEVKKVIYYPDSDATGQKAAQKIATTLHQTDIQFQAFRLPDHLGEKGDINKLWQWVGFDKVAFQNALSQDTQKLDFQIKPPPAPRPTKIPISRSDDNPDYFTAIEQTLGISHYNPDGWSQEAIPCPFGDHQHDDQKPAAYWHQEWHILNCFKCGIHYLAKDVGKVLGIHWNDFLPDRQANKSFQAIRKSSQAINGASTYFPNGIPDLLRETLLNLHHNTQFHDQAPSLMILELHQHGIAHGKYQPDDDLTFDELFEYAAQIGWQTSEGIIRRGLKQLLAFGFMVKRSGLPDSKGRPTDIYQAQPLEKALHRLREVMRYRIHEQTFGERTPDTLTTEWFVNLPPEMADELIENENKQRAELYERFQNSRAEAERQSQDKIRQMERKFSFSHLSSLHSTPLLDDMTCQHGYAYRDLFYKSLIADQGLGGRTIARARARNQIGVSDSTLSKIRIRTGIIADLQYQELEIREPKDVLQAVNQAMPWAAKNEYGRFLESSNGNRKGLFDNRREEIDHWAKAQMEQGNTIIANIQSASRERLASSEEIAVLQLKREQHQEKRAELKKEGTYAGSVHNHRQKVTSSQLPAILRHHPQRDQFELYLAHINKEEAFPVTFSQSYVAHQLALTPGKTFKAFLHQMDLFSYLPPLEILNNDSSRGSKKQNKWLEEKKGREPPD